uniref:Prefoldin subunit 4 n=1 Tax=Trichuris muris TaxID=70415 RepID=A0A5S6PZQ2_TRIMR
MREVYSTGKDVPVSRVQCKKICRFAVLNTRRTAAKVERDVIAQALSNARVASGELLLIDDDSPNPWIRHGEIFVEMGSEEARDTVNAIEEGLQEQLDTVDSCLNSNALEMQKLRKVLKRDFGDHIALDEE